MSALRLLNLDIMEDLLSINIFAASLNDGIADLPDEHDKSSWRIVVLGVCPDEENGVHNWHKEVGRFMELP